MMKNVRLKRFLKATVCKPLNFLNKLIKKDDKLILLHISSSGIRHNLKPVKEYLLQNHYDDKYKIVCSIKNLKYADNDTDRVTYVTYPKTIWTFFHAGHVFYTAGQIPIKPSKKQMVIFFDHGTAAFKTGGALSNIHNGDEFFFTYILAPSQLYVSILKEEYLCGDKNILISGEPMTDMLYEPIHPYDLGDYKKVVFWMPTFRQSRNTGYDDSSEHLLPLFRPEEYTQLDEVLKKLQIKVIVKVHIGQDLDELQRENKEKLENLEILSHDAFTEKGYEIYELMKQVDALIGDYSSASLHFLHVDKPMGFVIPDIEEYKKTRGFVFEHPEDYMAGELIYTKEQLYQFLDDLAHDVDKYAAKRKKVRDEVFVYQDGENTRRALKISGITLD